MKIGDEVLTVDVENKPTMFIYNISNIVNILHNNGTHY
jgi:hypothetical protein